MKKIISYLLISTIFFLIGCSSNSINYLNSIENNKTVKTTIKQKNDSDGSIYFNSFYEGFILENDIFELPQGIVLLNTESEWNTFKNKYFSKSTDMDYGSLPEEDFTRQSIIYYSILGPLPTIFSSSFQIDKIQVSNNTLNIVTKEISSTGVTVTNNDVSIHRFVVLATVDKADIQNIVMPSGENVDKKWESIDRLRYIQGEIVALKKISNGRAILSLRVEKNYHGSPDPIDDEDSPFERGTIVNFYINSQPQIDLGKTKKVIVYESHVTTDGEDSFLAASIKCYENNGIFTDKSGKQISLPPEEYPNTL